MKKGEALFEEMTFEQDENASRLVGKSHKPLERDVRYTTAYVQVINFTSQLRVTLRRPSRCLCLNLVQARGLANMLISDEPAAAG